MIIWRIKEEKINLVRMFEQILVKNILIRIFNNYCHRQRRNLNQISFPKGKVSLMRGVQRIRIREGK